MIINVPDPEAGIYGCWNRVYRKFIRDIDNKTEQEYKDIEALEVFLETQITTKEQHNGTDAV